jgi:hypothetical protein
MSAEEIYTLQAQISELRERVVKLETYVKVVGAFITIVPTAIQLWGLWHR